MRWCSLKSHNFLQYSCDWEKDLDRCAFAGAVGTEKAEDLPAADLEIDAAQGLELPVGLREALNLGDHFLCVHTSIVRPRRWPR